MGDRVVFFNIHHGNMLANMPEPDSSCENKGINNCLANLLRGLNVTRYAKPQLGSGPQCALSVSFFLYALGNKILGGTWSTVHVNDTGSPLPNALSDSVVQKCGFEAN